MVAGVALESVSNRRHLSTFVATYDDVDVGERQAPSVYVSWCLYASLPSDDLIILNATPSLSLGWTRRSLGTSHYRGFPLERHISKKIKVTGSMLPANTSRKSDVIQVALHMSTWTTIEKMHEDLGKKIDLKTD